MLQTIILNFWKVIIKTLSFLNLFWVLSAGSTLGLLASDLSTCSTLTPLEVRANVFEFLPQPVQPPRFEPVHHAEIRLDHLSCKLFAPSPYVRADIHPYLANLPLLSAIHSKLKFPQGFYWFRGDALKRSIPFGLKDAAYLMADGSIQTDIRTLCSMGTELNFLTVVPKPVFALQGPEITLAQMQFFLPGKLSAKNKALRTCFTNLKNLQAQKYWMSGWFIRPLFIAPRLHSWVEDSGERLSTHLALSDFFELVNLSSVQVPAEQFADRFQGFEMQTLVEERIHSGRQKRTYKLQSTLFMRNTLSSMSCLFLDVERKPFEILLPKLAPNSLFYLDSFNLLSSEEAHKLISDLAPAKPLLQALRFFGWNLSRATEMSKKLALWPSIWTKCCTDPSHKRLRWIHCNANGRLVCEQPFPNLLAYPVTTRTRSGVLMNHIYHNFFSNAGSPNLETLTLYNEGSNQPKFKLTPLCPTSSFPFYQPRELDSVQTLLLRSRPSSPCACHGSVNNACQVLITNEPYPSSELDLETLASFNQLAGIHKIHPLPLGLYWVKNPILKFRKNAPVACAFEVLSNGVVRENPALCDKEANLLTLRIPPKEKVI